MDFYPSSYHKNYNQYKRKVIDRWTRWGVIYHNLDELYEVYINTMDCQFCKKEFKNSTDRCLDHDHTSGLFRKIICRGCNNQDCYLKYPLEYTTLQKRKEYHKKWRDSKERLNCFFCNKEMSKFNLTRHFKDSHCPMIKPK